MIFQGAHNFGRLSTTVLFTAVPPCPPEYEPRSVQQVVFLALGEHDGGDET